MTIASSNVGARRTEIFSSPKMSTVLGSFLECITHEIIYTRSLYPHDAFSPTRHYGISCHACRHPKVVEYIVESLSVAVPSVLNGVVDEIRLVFYDDETDEIFEVYSFRFQVDSIVQIQSGITNVTHASNGFNSDKQKASFEAAPSELSEREELDIKIGELERGLRDVLLRIVSLDGTLMGRKRGTRQFPSSATFKICLHARQDSYESSNSSSMTTTPTQENQKRQCPELEEALQNGTWFRPDVSTCEFTKSDRNIAVVEVGTSVNECDTASRSLKSMNIPSCGIAMEVNVELLSKSVSGEIDKA